MATETTNNPRLHRQEHLASIRSFWNAWHLILMTTLLEMPTTLY